MPDHGLDTVARYLVGLARHDDEGDAELLGRFLERGDPAAFEGLLRRHGPMVLGVCRRIAGPDAEDAFQATFLVLVRKAGSVSPRGAVGAWLHGGADRTSLDARTRRSRIRQREGHPMEAEPPAPPADDGARELLPLLDREIARLPAGQRDAVILCELECRPRHEAARLLGVPEGTLSSRLAAARKRLARRLGASAGAALAVAGTAAMPARLAAAVMAGLAPAALMPPAVNALLQGALMSMLVKKVQTLTVAVLALAVLAGAVGLGGRDNATAQPPGETKKDDKPPAKSDKDKGDDKKDKDKPPPVVKENQPEKPSALQESLKKHEGEIGRIRKAMLEEVAAEEKKAEAAIKKSRDDAAEAGKKRDNAAVRKAHEAGTEAQKEKSRLWRIRTDIESRIRMGVPKPPAPAEARLGLGLSGPGAALRAHLGLAKGKGLVVDHVGPGSPADKAGFKTHDVLLEIGGKPVPDDLSAFRKAFADAKLDDAEASVLRAGKPQALKGLTLPADK